MLLLLLLLLLRTILIMTTQQSHSSNNWWWNSSIKFLQLCSTHECFSTFVTLVSYTFPFVRVLRFERGPNEVSLCLKCSKSWSICCILAVYASRLPSRLQLVLCGGVTVPGMPSGFCHHTKWVGKFVCAAQAGISIFWCQLSVGTVRAAVVISELSHRKSLS